MKLKNSFRMQFAFVFVALMASCILISILASNLLLKSYYSTGQIKKLESVFETINKELGSQKVLTESGIKQELDRISANNNFAICLFDRFGNYAKYTSEGNDSRLVNTLISYILDGTDMTASSCRKIESNSDYSIYESTDAYLDATNYDLVGELDNNIICLVRVNYAGIEQSARLANNFYARAGLVIIIVEAFLIVIILRRFTTPILKMNDVAKRMADLDFEAKAEVTSSNEIGQLAESLNTLSSSLEEKILELKSANSKLQVDLEKREKIDEMRKDFLGNVSHELKTPIAIIQGYAEGLREGISDDPESREFYCDVIIDEAAKMSNMVKKLLSLNKLEYGEDQLEFSRFDVVELIKGVLAASEVLAGNKKVNVIFDEPGPHYVYADEYMIEETVTNFVSNAYHYVAEISLDEILEKDYYADYKGARAYFEKMKAEKETSSESDSIIEEKVNVIIVSFSKLEKGLRVSVYNSGSSIPEDSLDRVWEKFYKVDKARTREYGGSGIGLSIVKAIMELHGRQCGVRNVYGGVEFFMELDDLARTEKHSDGEKRGNE